MFSHVSARDVREQWLRLDAWLASHIAGLGTRLRPPADAVLIAATETDLGIVFPEELAASLAVHDGQEPPDEVLGEWFLLPCHEIVARTRYLRSNAGTAPLIASPGVQLAWWHAAWIAWAKNGSGDYLAIDADPAPGGQLGQVLLYFHDLERRDAVAPSLSAWLRSFTDELEADRYEVVGDHALRPRDLDD